MIMVETQVFALCILAISCGCGVLATTTKVIEATDDFVQDFDRTVNEGKKLHCILVLL